MNLNIYGENKIDRTKALNFDKKSDEIKAP
jgi:hypothetical protein